jgi:DNA gyrase subunit B
VDLATLNALSERLLVRIERDGMVWEQEYHRGLPSSPLEAMCETSRTGTSISFWPDREIFKRGTTFEQALLVARLRELAFLRPGFEIAFQDRRSGTESSETFRSADGLADFLRYLNQAEQALHTCICIHGQETDAHGKPVTVSAALQWVLAPGLRERSFVCTYETTAGGVHVVGFRRGLSEAVRSVMAKHDGGVRHHLDWEDIGDGLSVVLSLEMPEPQFSGATRATLCHPEVDALVTRVVEREMLKYLESHEEEARTILARVRRGRNPWL